MSLAKAIQNLRPGSEFVITDDDYSKIIWHKLDGDAPTNVEIEQALTDLEAIEAAEIAAKEQAKLAAQAKLEALGLTAEDLKALGL